MKLQEYHLNYSSVKTRGIDKDITYTLTVHKYPVKKSGYEFPSNIKPTYQSLLSKIDYDEVAEDESYFKRFTASLSRSKSNIIQLVANNHWQYFCTFTFSDEKCKEYNISRYDIKAIKKVVLQFFVNYSRRSGLKTNFKYVLIPEFHKDGAVHFHGVMSGINQKDLKVNKYGYLDFVPYVERFGFCSLGHIKDLTKCANYISKYMSKDMFFGKQMKQGFHLYFASKGLKKDTTIVVGSLKYPLKDFVKNCDESQCCSISEFINDGVIDFENQFENEYCAKFSTKDKNISDYVEPFEERFVVGINIPLAPSEKQLKKAKKNAVVKYCNTMGIDVKTLNVSFDLMFKYIMNNYCLNEYDRLKEDISILKTKLKNNEFKLNETELKIENLKEQSANLRHEGIDCLYFEPYLEPNPFDNKETSTACDEQYDVKQIYEIFNREPVKCLTHSLNNSPPEPNVISNHEQLKLNIKQVTS